MNSAKSQNSTGNLPLIENYTAFTKNDVRHSISHYFSQDFFYIEYLLCPVENDEVCLNILDEQGLYFVFCWEEPVRITINGSTEETISEYQSAIIYDKEAKGICLTFEKRCTYRFCIIGFNQHENGENTCYSKCRDLFFAQMPLNKKIFIGRSYFKLIDKMNHLSKTVQCNSDSELIIEGLIYQIFGIKMNHLSEAMNGNPEDYGVLTFREMKSIKFISETIRANPSFEYTIEFLCRETNLSPFKLQEGFKRLYNSTVINFIRDIRLEKALELLEKSDLTISEIVYSIGLTSRSYFSKIFKQKYKCSPKIYKAQKIPQELVE